MLTTLILGLFYTYRCFLFKLYNIRENAMQQKNNTFRYLALIFLRAFDKKALPHSGRS